MADLLVDPLVKRKKVLFAGRENRCRSQMAAVFAQVHAGGRIEALCAGSVPAEKIDPAMQEAMAEKKIDMGFRIPRTIEDVVAHDKPDTLVAMGCDDPCGDLPGATWIDWDIDDPVGQGLDAMRRVRDEIETKVMELMDSLDAAS